MEEKWTKVEEGLPEPGEKVLVVTKYDTYALCQTYTFGGKIKWSGSWKFTDVIRAWRPIPKLDIDKPLK